MKFGLAQGKVGARVIKEHQVKVCVVVGIGQHRVETAVGNTGIPGFIARLFIGLHRCCIFCKLKARLSTSRKITTRFFFAVTLYYLQYLQGMPVITGLVYPTKREQKPKGLVWATKILPIILFIIFPQLPRILLNTKYNKITL